MRHFSFAIGVEARNQWVLCMRKALDEDLRETLFQAPAQTATHMINRND